MEIGGTTLLEILYAAPVREREDWLVYCEVDADDRIWLYYWTGARWDMAKAQAAHFANMEGGLAVVRMLESMVPDGMVRTRPVKED